MSELIVYCKYVKEAEWESDTRARLDGLQSTYLRAQDLFRLKFPPRFRSSFFFWRCAVLVLSDYESFPRVHLILRGSSVVHYSFVLPRLGRIPEMADHDFEIGPCWTQPDCRRTGLFSYALSRIQRDYFRKGRRFWMICRVENLPSIYAIEKAGFELHNRCWRTALLWRFGHSYTAVGKSGILPLVTKRGMERDKDKHVEQQRYDQRFKGAVGKIDDAELTCFGARAINLVLRRPYLVYERFLKEALNDGLRVLDICCGTGLHSFHEKSDDVFTVGCDISFSSLCVADRRARVLELHFSSVCCDCERLPLQDGSFDLVTTVGSISYCDCDLLIGEICRMLKPSGTWIFVDSYNFNPIYRVNRVIRFWRGELSRSVILRIPDRRTIQSLRLHFNDVEVSYYGIFSFLGPFLSRILGETSAASIINGLDEHLPFLKQFAFKIVVTARK